jgi:hypothetical protein
MKKKYTREEFNKLMKDYKSGKKGIQPGHPDEINNAIKSFLDFSLILTEYPDITHIPPEVVENLLKTLSKYPAYNKLTLELIDILNHHR